MGCMHPNLTGDVSKCLEDCHGGLELRFSPLPKQRSRPRQPMDRDGPEGQRQGDGGVCVGHECSDDGDPPEGKGWVRRGGRAWLGGKFID